MGADPRVRAHQRRPGAGEQGADAPLAARRLAPHPHRRGCIRSGVLLRLYASVALARSLFRKGANFTAAMAFQFASTNLVVELGIILAVLIGWQFTAGEFLGGPIMIALMALLFRRFLKPELVEDARREADRGVLGRMEGHAEMDMSITEGGSIWTRLRSPQGFTAVSNYFAMD
jgi:uncharacterized membrane protein YraQ (UPF0718 family)